MKVIYKYRLPFQEVSTVEMPAKAEIIRVDGLDGALWLWAIVDPDEPTVNRVFHLFKTGGELPEDISEYNYIGCGSIFIQMELMMYVFEKILYTVELTPTPETFNWGDIEVPAT